MSSRVVFWISMVEAVLLASIMLAALRFSESKASLNDAAFNVQRGSQLASQIESLRKLSSVASESVEPEELSNQRLVDVARGCGISEKQMRSINRLTPSKIENTDYQRQDISIELNRVSMEQIVKLTLAAEQFPGKLSATSLNLTHAGSTSQNRRGPANEEQWNAQMILTQLVYIATRSKR